MNYKPLKYAHFGCWLLLLTQMALYAATGLTFRFSEINIIIGGLLFFSGFALFLSRRKHAGRFGRLYYWFYPLYPLIIIITFYIERLLAIILLVPVWAMVLNHTTYMSNSPYAIRITGGVLAVPQPTLYRNHFIFTKEVGNLYDFPVYEYKDTFTHFRVNNSAGHPHSVTLYTSTFDTTFSIYR